MFIPLSVPEITAADQAQVQACLASGWVSSAGPWVEAFEQQMASHLGSAHAVAVSSGTAALHLSLRLAGVEAGDLVLMPDLTFIAPAHAVRYLGAEPVLVDVDPQHWQMDWALTRRFLEEACTTDGQGCRHRASGRRVAALLLVHALGYAAPADQFADLAEQHGLPLIEDAAEALGSSLQGRALGTFGRLGCLSFNGNKILTTGGGGMILTPDAELASLARHLSTQARHDAYRYEHDALGYNYRLNSMAAALGSSQLTRFSDTLARKRSIANRYCAALPQLRWPQSLPHSQPNLWLMTPLVPQRDKLAEQLRVHQIDRRCLWLPLHQQPLFRDCQFLSEARVSEQLFASGLSLPSSVGLREEEQQRVIDVVQGHLAD